jgi:hypothetical protein
MKMEENGKSNRKELLATGINHHPLPKVFSSFSFNYFSLFCFFKSLFSLLFVFSNKNRYPSTGVNKKKTDKTMQK